MKNGTHVGIQDKVNVYVDVCEDEIITIEYYHYSTIFSTKKLPISKLRNCGLKPSNINQTMTSEQPTTQLNSSVAEDVVTDKSNLTTASSIILIIAVSVVISVMVVVVIIILIIRAIKQKKDGGAEI